MTKKRFTYEYDEYTGNLFDNKMNTFYPIEDSDENIEVLCDRLNWLVEENERLKEYNNKLMKQPLLFDVQTIPNTMEIMEANTQLEEENEQLKRNYNSLSHNNGLLHDECTNKINVLKKENEQLKQRNNRQAKQLDRLYHLIEEKDWRTLTDILDDFKRCEEQLQKEWGTYGDVE